MEPTAAPPDGVSEVQNNTSDPSVTETLSIIDAQAKEDAITRSQWVRLSDEDEEELQEYLEAEADDSEVSDLEEEAKIKRAEKLLNEDKDYAAARAILFAVLLQSPNLKVCWKNCGNSFLDDHMSELACLCYKKAIQIDADYGDAWYDLGIACTTLRLLNEAKICYRRAIEINHKDTDALNNLGLLFYREEDNQWALRLFEAAVAHKKGSPDLVANKCLCLASLGLKDEAYREYLRGIRENMVPSTTILNNFVILLHGMGKYGEMRHFATRLLRMKPSSYRAWSHLGTAMKSLGDLTAAEIAYKTSVKLEPHYLEGWSNLGHVYGRRGRHAEAISLISWTQAYYHDATSLPSGLFYTLATLANDVIEKRKYE